MWGWNSSGSSLGAFIGWILILPIGLIISGLISFFKKNRQILYFISGWWLWIIGSLLLTLKTENKEYLKVEDFLFFLLLSFISLFFSYRKSQNKLKTTGYIILNLILVSLFIFLLNR